MSSPALLRSSPCSSPAMPNAFLACRLAAAVSDMVADSYFAAVGSPVEKSAAMSSSVARSAGSPAVARAGRPLSHSSSSIVAKLLRADSESSSNQDDDDEDDYSDWDDESEDEVDGQQAAWDTIPEELQFCGLFCPMANHLPTRSSSKTNNNKTPDAKKDYACSERKISSESDAVNGDRLSSSSSEAESETLLDEDFLNSLLQVEGHHLRGAEHNSAAVSADSDRLKRINSDWNFTYGCVHDQDGTCNCDRREEAPRVRFSRPETWARISEDPELSCDLREARKSDLMQRRADRERLERVLAPVLAPDHRRKVYQRMQQQQQKSEEESSGSAASSHIETSGQQDFTLSNKVCR